MGQGERTGAQTLSGSEVHVWYLDPDAPDAERLRAAHWDVLSADEREAYNRLRVEGSRQQYLVSHALLRAVLSRYAAVAPRDWLFAKNAHGRPEIAAPPGAVPLRFNLSHTRGLVACGVTLRRDIGVDVEHVHERPRHLALARRFFAAAEADALAAWPAAGRDTRFLEYWTLKESYIKARGLGLSLPLRRFAFELRPDSPVHVSFDRELRDDPQQWQFALLRPTEHHVLAVAAKREDAAVLTIEVRQADRLLNTN
jgi:4'-phosphopantetheinyl transferase